MRRVLQLAAVLAWGVLAAHDHGVALAVLPTLALVLVADDAPGVDRLVRSPAPEPVRPGTRTTRRVPIAAAHRATGRPFVRPPFSSRPPPAALPA